ncbi:MAG: hypothetical protein WBP10_20445 [Thermoanaerobaculia bacterium]
MRIRSMSNQESSITAAAMAGTLVGDVEARMEPQLASQGLDPLLGQSLSMASTMVKGRRNQ